MTLGQFERQLKKISPKLRIRQRGYGDIVGLYGGSGYICRLTKGELNMNGYKTVNMNPDTGEQMGATITKRGRKTVLNLLRNFRWINARQRSQIIWGNL